MKKILIVGYIGFENFGDEAILSVLIKNLLETRFNKEDITVISNNPAGTQNNHNINAISRWNPFGILGALFNADAIIFIGGLFQDKTSFQSFLYYFLFLLFARIFQKEIVFYGCGIGPFKRKLTQVLFNYGTSKAYILTVRDHFSTNYTPFREHTQVSCDPVLVIEPDFNAQTKITSINWKHPILGVSMKYDKAVRPHHLKSISEKLARILNGMEDWQVLFIPCMPKEDLPVSYELHDLMLDKSTHTDRTFLIENFSGFSVNEQAGILASCDVMLGMRYHSLLVPIANGKPVFGLITDPKIKSLLDFSNQVGVTFRDNVDEPWNYFWQNIGHSTDLAKQTQDRASRLHRKNLELLKQLAL